MDPSGADPNKWLLPKETSAFHQAAAAPFSDGSSLATADRVATLPPPLQQSGGLEDCFRRAISASTSMDVRMLQSTSSGPELHSYGALPTQGRMRSELGGYRFGPQAGFDVRYQGSSRRPQQGLAFPQPSNGSHRYQMAPERGQGYR